MMFDGFIEVDLLKFNTKSSIFDTRIRSESEESGVEECLKSERFWF